MSQNCVKNLRQSSVLCSKKVFLMHQYGRHGSKMGSSIQRKPEWRDLVAWWLSNTIHSPKYHFCISSNFRYEPSREMKSQWTAVWVKISSSWIGIVLYVWTLVAPLVLTNRDFDWMGLLAWKPIFGHCLFDINSIPSFCKVVCVVV